MAYATGVALVSRALFHHCSPHSGHDAEKSKWVSCVENWVFLAHFQPQTVRISNTSQKENLQDAGVYVGNPYICLRVCSPSEQFTAEDKLSPLAGACWGIHGKLRSRECPKEESKEKGRGTRGKETKAPPGTNRAIWAIALAAAGALLAGGVRRSIVQPVRSNRRLTAAEKFPNGGPPECHASIVRLSDPTPARAPTNHSAKGRAARDHLSSTLGCVIRQSDLLEGG